MASVAGVSDMYIHIGHADWVCDYCGASFWYGEHLKSSTNSRIRYNRCCGENKVHRMFKYRVGDVRAYELMGVVNFYGNPALLIEWRARPGLIQSIISCVTPIQSAKLDCRETNDLLTFLQYNNALIGVTNVYGWTR